MEKIEVEVNKNEQEYRCLKQSVSESTQKNGKIWGKLSSKNRSL